MQPIVSIIIPVYNAQDYIRATIESVLVQTYTEWELVLVNDGSTDESPFILEEFASTHPNKIKLIHKKNTGVSDTRNLGIANAKGKYIALLDADDQWLKDNLKTKVDYLELNNEVSFVFSDMFITDMNLLNSKLAPIGNDSNILNNLLLWNGEVIPGPCSNLVIRKKCFEEGVRFKTKLSTIADQNLTVQLAYKYKGKRIPSPLWNYRVLSTSMSKSISVMERDCLATYLDYWKSGYFNSKLFQLRCYSNMYLILAGSFWKHTQRKGVAVNYILTSIFYYPPNVMQLVKKLFRI